MCSTGQEWILTMAEIDMTTQLCPRFHHAVELIGRRWTGAILAVMFDGATRFTEITHGVPGLSDRLLSERLKELEAQGIVTRIVHPETPVRIEYQLTSKGADLRHVTEAITDWAERWTDVSEPVVVASGAMTRVE